MKTSPAFHLLRKVHITDGQIFQHKCAEVCHWRTFGDHDGTRLRKCTECAHLNSCLSKWLPVRVRDSAHILRRFCKVLEFIEVLRDEAELAEEQQGCFSSGCSVKALHDVASGGMMWHAFQALEGPSQSPGIIRSRSAARL